MPISLEPISQQRFGKVRRHFACQMFSPQLCESVRIKFVKSRHYVKFGGIAHWGRPVML